MTQRIPLNKGQDIYSAIKKQWFLITDYLNPRYFADKYNQFCCVLFKGSLILKPQRYKCSSYIVSHKQSCRKVRHELREVFSTSRSATSFGHEPH